MKTIPVFTCVIACLVSAAEALLPEVPKLDRSQITASFIVENAKAVAGIGMAVLGAGVIVMILLSLLGNVGLNQDQHSSDGAYAPATVEVHAHKKGKPQTQFISG